MHLRNENIDIHTHMELHTNHKKNIHLGIYCSNFALEQWDGVWICHWHVSQKFIPLDNQLPLDFFTKLRSFSLIKQQKRHE